MPGFFSWLRAPFARGLAGMRALFSGPARRPLGYWDHDIELTLTKLVRETQTEASGRVQLLSLVSFRDDIGELWDQYKDRIVLIADTTIARGIGRGNTYIQQDEDTWLLLFPGLDEPEALRRADEIARKIGEKLIGERFAPEEARLPEAAELDLAMLKAGVSREAMRAAVARGKARNDATFATAGAKKPGAQAPRPTAVVTEPSRIQDIALTYRPIWSAETQAIDTFLLRAKLAGESVLDDGGPAMNETTTIDLVRTSLDAYAAMRRAKLRAKFVLPLPASALSTRVLTEVQRLITAIPREERLLTLRLAFCKLPARATAEQLIALREVFRPYAREVVFPVNPFDPLDPASTLDHIVAMADVTNESDRIDAEFFDLMTRFRSRTGSRLTCVVGLRRRSHLAQAIAAGISELGGPVVAEEIRHLPEKPEVVLREQLVRV